MDLALRLPKESTVSCLITFLITNQKKVSVWCGCVFYVSSLAISPFNKTQAGLRVRATPGWILTKSLCSVGIAFGFKRAIYFRARAAYFAFTIAV